MARQFNGVYPFTTSPSIVALIRIWVRVRVLGAFNQVRPIPLLSLRTSCSCLGVTPEAMEIEEPLLT